MKVKTLCRCLSCGDSMEAVMSHCETCEAHDREQALIDASLRKDRAEMLALLRELAAILPAQTDQEHRREMEIVEGPLAALLMRFSEET